MKAPVFNKQKQYLRAMDQKNLEIHSHKLQNMQPIMKTSILSNWERGPDKKRQYILEERFTQIEKDNRLLLEKIMGIMQNKTTYGSFSPPQVRPKSLNISRRRMDQENIVRENIKLLKRIQERKSNYAKSTFDKSWKINSKYSQNLGSYYSNLKRQTTSTMTRNQRAHSYNNTFNEKLSNHEQDCNLSVD